VVLLSIVAFKTLKFYKVV